MSENRASEGTPSPATPAPSLRELAERATPGPWKVVREANPLNELGRETFPDGLKFDNAEPFIVTEWDHPQLHGPESIFGVGVSPYTERSHALWIQDNNAAYIAAANPSAILALLDALASEVAKREQAERNYALVSGRYDFWKGIAKGAAEELGLPLDGQAAELRPAIASTRSALREAQEAVEGWYADSVQAQYEVMFARFGDDADGDVRCGVANLSNANRIIRKVRAAAGSTTP